MRPPVVVTLWVTLWVTLGVTLGAALGTTVLLAGPGVRADAQLTADAVYRAYAAGDDTAVARWVSTLPATESPYGTITEVRSGVWDRVAAAFLLEVAAGNPASGRSVSALARGRAMVMNRPSPLGQDPVEDRFEILWHQAALGIAQRHHAVSSQDEYLIAVEPRFADAERRGVRLNTRLPLARAITAASMCCDARGRAMPRLSASGQRLELPTLDIAVRYFDEAGRQDDLKAEALIRGGKLLFEAGQYNRALDRFTQVPADVAPVLRYVRHLTHARVLDSLQRPSDAAEEYQRALGTFQNGQLAGIGLAAALFRLDRTEEAARAADAARRMPPTAGRGFLDFDAADYRFVGEWLAEVRMLRR